MSMFSNQFDEANSLKNMGSPTRRMAMEDYCRNIVVNERINTQNHTLEQESQEEQDPPQPVGHRLYNLHAQIEAKKQAMRDQKQEQLKNKEDQIISK